MADQYYLLRVGLCGETVRSCSIDHLRFQRGDNVVLQTDRGEMIARVMRPLPGDIKNSENAAHNQIVRIASNVDLERHHKLKQQAEQEFNRWVQRIQNWQVDVELVDLEWTLDEKKLILYVLNGRGPECTKLAIQAAAQGLGVIDVVPVSATGIKTTMTSGCGCGSGGCSR